MRRHPEMRKVPQITNCVVERIEENQRNGCEMGIFWQS
jgi:hypothetical protein